MFTALPPWAVIPDRYLSPLTPWREPLKNQCCLSIKEPVRNLRSCSDTSLFHIQRTKHSWGDRAFSFAAPRMWNHLPQNIRQSSSLANFKTLLKSHLFSKAYCTVLWATTVGLAPYKFNDWLIDWLISTNPNNWKFEIILKQNVVWTGA